MSPTKKMKFFFFFKPLVRICVPVRAFETPQRGTRGGGLNKGGDPKLNRECDFPMWRVVYKEKDSFKKGFAIAQRLGIRHTKGHRDHYSTTKGTLEKHRYKHWLKHQYQNRHK